MTRKFLFAAGIAALFAGPASAQSGSCTTSPCITNFSVFAEVTASCSSIDAADIDFGSSPAIAGSRDVATTINLVCTVGTPYTVELDYGITPTSPGSSQRQVSDFASGQYMDYTIFQPGAGGAAATTAPWGLAADNQEYVGTGTGTSQALTATGRLDQTDSVAPGSYTDLVTVFLNY